MSHALGVPAAVAMFAAAIWGGYLVARRIGGSAGFSVRVAGALIAAHVLSLLLFSLLAASRVFRLPVAMGAWAIVVGVLHRRLDGAGAIAIAQTDLQTALAHAREFLATWPRRAVVAIAVVAMGTRLLVGLAAPPVAWDAFLYHAFKPARWVQAGGLFVDRAPDQWRYLQFFPHGGEVPWAWSMLATGDDALLAAAGVVMWVTLALAGALAARGLGATPRAAGYAGLAIAFLPPVASVSISTYVDDTVAAAFLLAVVPFAAAMRSGPQGQTRLALLAVMGFGWMAACKSTGLPMLALALAGLLWAHARATRGRPLRDRARGLGWLAAGVAVVVALLAPAYLSAWLETGSPFYPLAVKIGGHTVFAGNAQLERLYAGTPELLATAAPLAHTLRKALLPAELDPTWEDYQGFGPSLLVLVVPAALGFWRRVARRESRVAALVVAAMAVLPVVAISGDGFAGLRAVWGVNIARLLLTLPCACVLFAAQVEARVMPTLWGLALALEWMVGVPGGLTPAMRGAMLAALPALAIVAAAGVVAALAWRHRAAASRAIAIAIAGAGLVAGGRSRAPGWSRVARRSRAREA
jgi:hypothetical protein